MAIICACAVCRRDISDGEAMADNKVFDIEGDLDYIELSHRDCAIADNAANPARSWQWEYDPCVTVS